MIIDIFPHLISERVIQFVGKKVEIQFKPPPENADMDARLRLMDKYSIDIHALSPTTPMLIGLNPDDAATVCRMSNEDNYAFCKAYPDRFVNICMISLLDVDSAMAELERSINELDCRGITVSSNQNGKGLDSKEYFSFYEKVEENDLPILIHPTNWEFYPLVNAEEGWNMMVAFGWPFDTTQAVWRLIFGGVLDRFPSLKIVMHHLGALFPFFAGRADVAAPFMEKLSRPFDEYWDNIYGDTAVSRTAAAVPCGYEFFGADRMVYASDYPFGAEDGEAFIRDHLTAVRALDIPEDELEKILGQNARALLKIE